MFLINIELLVHEFVIIETGHIDARFKHEEIIITICAEHITFFAENNITCCNNVILTN